MKHNTAKIITRSQIEEAQRHTNSNFAAARWLSVSYQTYKKYAELYNLFEQHLNPSGVGIDKGWSKRPSSIPLKDILAGKHPTYSPAKLKNRLIARKKLIEACSLCGFDEKRITDRRAPLMLNFIDGDHKNFQLANLNLLCYNCMFLTTGAPSIVNKRHLTSSLIRPDKVPATQSIPMTHSDQFDVDDLEGADIILTEAERQALLADI